MCKQLECTVCGLPGSPPTTCGACGAVNYCCREHQAAHWQLEHSEACERMAGQMAQWGPLMDLPLPSMMVRSPELCSFLSKEGLHHGAVWQAECSCAGALIPDDSSAGPPLERGGGVESLLTTTSELPNGPPPSPLTSWLHYYHWRGCPLAWPGAVALHTVLTLHHALLRTSPELQAPPTAASRAPVRWTIHLLGPAKELLQLSLFRELLLLLPGTALELHMVGPRVPRAWDRRQITLHGSNSESVAPPSASGDASALQPGSRGISEASSLPGCQLQVTFHHGLYHEVCMQMKEPDLIFAPNAGIAAFQSWRPTMLLLAARAQPPVVLTDFNAEALHLARVCIESMGTESRCGEIEVNPFRRPIVESLAGSELPSFSNGFMMVLNPR